MADPFKNEGSSNFLPHLLIALIFYWRPTSLKSVTMATRNAPFSYFEFQNVTDKYLGKVTKLGKLKGFLTFYILGFLGDIFDISD